MDDHCSSLLLNVNGVAGLVTRHFYWLLGFAELEDFVIQTKGQAMKHRSLKNNFKMSWFLKEEISKAIKIGVSFGFDFNDKEVGLANIFAKAKRRLILSG
ncbi:hypothetical protein LWI28_018742 [Acer negundo]|uniref:Uncharacterized protein n=1 Tax=Acer negundo TaxID=4023 RepID=A0AAD5IAX0_ACENE|nr:hypothetical protein LWI28_018742 [Acer negundo]